MKRRFVVGVIGAVVMLAIASSPSAAHTVTGTHYPVGWQERTINIYFSGSSWTNIPSIRDRLLNGAAQWSNLSGGGGFTYAWGTASLSSTACNPLNVNGIFWENLDGGGPILGETRFCPVPGQPARIQSFNLVVDGAQPNWYTGTATPPVASQDLWGLASHEFGHGTGFFLGNGLHWDNVDSTLCPVSSSQHTMCNTSYTGTTWWRGITTHDIHTFTNRY
jgi:hypothetical protein